MRIYWWQGSLTIQPESDRERSLLCDLAAQFKVTTPLDAGAQHSGVGQTLCGEFAHETVVVDQDVHPSRLASTHGNKKPVVLINKTL